MKVEYCVWDDQYGYVYTNMFQCLGVTKTGRRCERYVSDGLFCHAHSQQELQLERECRKFFRLDINRHT